MNAERKRERLRKQAAIQALLVRLQPDEVYVAIRIILQAHHAISLSLDIFLTWMHPSAASVLQTCVPFFAAAWPVQAPLVHLASRSTGDSTAANAPCERQKFPSNSSNLSAVLAWKPPSGGSRCDNLDTERGTKLQACEPQSCVQAMCQSR